MDVVARSEANPKVPSAPPKPVALSPLRVWWSAYLHHLRLLRNQAVVWILAVAGLGGAVAGMFGEAFPTQADREAMARTIEGVPAFEALFGRAVELATLEGFVLWRWGGIAVFVVSIWGMLSSTKLLRGAEEAGQMEVLRSGVIGSRSLLDAAFAALLTTHLALGIAIGITHTAFGMDAGTAWAFGATLALLAATFAAAGALASQVADSRRRANGLVGLAFGVALGIRVLAAGTGTPEWLWWATPFGWAGYLHPVDQARHVVLLAFPALVAVLYLAASKLAARDLHAGILAAGERARSRSRPLRGLTPLAVRLNLGAVLAWGAGLVAGGLVFGLLAEDFAAVVAELPGFVELAEQLGMVGFGTPEGVIAAVLGFFFVVVLALFAVSQASSIREEESSWRIEHLLSRPVGRIGWLAGRAAVSAVAIAVLALCTAAAAWIGMAMTGVAPGLARMLLAAVNLMPMPWLFLGLGIALVGMVPRATAAVGYSLVLLAYVLEFLGGMLELPEAVLRLGPLRHLAPVPVAELAVGPALVMVGVGLAAATAGAIVFKRRDLQEA